MNKFLIIFTTLAIWQAKAQFHGGVMRYSESSSQLTKCGDNPQMFKEDERECFNCTVSSGPEGGDHFCTDAPCGQSDECSWQVSPGIDVKCKPGSLYTLHKCEKCPTENCNDKYSVPRHEECGRGGVFKTKTYGTTWYCNNTQCKGEMRERADKAGYYECIDEKCWGTGKLNNNYKCEDDTCTSSGGYMFWNNTIHAWDCDNFKCSKTDAMMVQKSDGWVCESPSCPGKMVQEDGFGSFNCIDPSCSGRIIFVRKGDKYQYICQEKSNSFYYVMGALVIISGILILKILTQKDISSLEKGLNDPKQSVIV